MTAEEGRSVISDHPHQAPLGQPWARCIHCGLAEAAHTASQAPYRPEERR